jgi:MFS family permease
MLLGPLFGGIAVFMTGMTTHVPVLFVTRLLEGSSTAASIPSTLGFIAAETAHDEKLRGRVVSVFEFVSLGGMLAVGPALAGILWDAFGRPRSSSTAPSTRLRSVCTPTACTRCRRSGERTLRHRQPRKGAR